VLKTLLPGYQTVNVIATNGYLVGRSVALVTLQTHVPLSAHDSDTLAILLEIGLGICSEYQIEFGECKYYTYFSYI
jgi:hypothetical protein